MRKKRLVVLSGFIIMASMLFTSCGGNKIITKESTSKNEKGLFTAIQNNDIESAKKSIEKGVNINSKDEFGFTPISQSIKMQNLELTKYFLSKNADVNITLISEQTCLMLSVYTNKIEFVSLVLPNTKDINAKNSVGETALEEAIGTDNKEIVELLISKGADVNNMDTQNRTPLSRIRSEVMMNLLLSKGANAETIVNKTAYNKGEKAIEVAKTTVMLSTNKPTIVVNEPTVVNEPRIGMKANEILNTTWGSPTSKNITTNAYGTNEQWVYPGNKYLYLDNGIITAMQTH